MNRAAATTRNYLQLSANIFPNGTAPKRLRSSRPIPQVCLRAAGAAAFGKTVTLREVLQLAARRLSPGDHYVGDAAAEIIVLCQVAEKVPIADARTEILKAIAILEIGPDGSAARPVTRSSARLSKF